MYIKARGLNHVQFGRIVETENGAHINLNKLRTILSSLKMPTVTEPPVHLEIIIQIEGKTVLFFFLNQQSFNLLTEGDSTLKNIEKFKSKTRFYYIRLFHSAESNNAVTSNG